MAVGCLPLDTSVRATHIVHAVCTSQICESVGHHYRDVDSLVGRSDLPGRVHNVRMCILAHPEEYSVFRWSLPEGLGAIISSSRLSLAGQLAI